MDRTYIIDQLLSGRYMNDVAKEVGRTNERIRQIARDGGLVNCFLCVHKVRYGVKFCVRCERHLHVLENSEIPHIEASQLTGIDETSVREYRRRLGVKAVSGRFLLPRPLPDDICDPNSRPSDLVKKYGVHPRTIDAARRRAGIGRQNSKYRRSWTSREQGILRKRLDAGIPKPAIAKELGRTVPAIESRITWLGWRK